MKHPTEEQWMEFLYEELPANEMKTMEQHLKVCTLCRQKRAGYAGTMKDLNSWEVSIPEKPRLAREHSPLLRWAAAAALVVTTAFATGRLSKPTVDAGKIQAEITGTLEEKMSQQLKARVQQEVESATERTLETVLLKFQSELASRLEAISEKAQATAAGDKEQLTLALGTLREQNKTLYSTLQEVENKRQADYRSLREDLEKVALFTDESLRTTRRQLVQLSSLGQESLGDEAKQ